jgi:Protein of unknown function (DUF2934)
MTDPHLVNLIRLRAYEIWESEGRPEGQGDRHWLRAEAQVRQKFPQGFGSASPSAKKAPEAGADRAKPAKAKAAKSRASARA